MNRWLRFVALVMRRKQAIGAWLYLVGSLCLVLALFLNSFPAGLAAGLCAFSWALIRKQSQVETIG